MAGFIVVEVGVGLGWGGCRLTLFGMLAAGGWTCVYGQFVYFLLARWCENLSVFEGFPGDKGGAPSGEVDCRRPRDSGMLGNARGILFVSTKERARDICGDGVPGEPRWRQHEPVSCPSFLQCSSPISSHLGPVAAIRLRRHASGRIDVAGARRSDFIRSGARTGNKLEDIGDCTYLCL